MYSNAVIKDLAKHFDLKKKFRVNRDSDKDEFNDAWELGCKIRKYILKHYSVTKKNAVYGATVWEGTSSNGVVSAELQETDWDVHNKCFYISSASGDVVNCKEAAEVMCTTEHLDDIFDDYEDEHGENSFLSLHDALTIDWEDK